MVWPVRDPEFVEGLRRQGGGAETGSSARLLAQECSIEHVGSAETKRTYIVGSFRRDIPWRASNPRHRARGVECGVAEHKVGSVR